MSLRLYIDRLQVTEEQLADFCGRWQISELAIFGSILRDDFGPDSDVDMLVTFAPSADWSLLDHIQMKEELASIIGRDVDLVSKRAIDSSENWIRRKHIQRTAQVVYASR
jgi:predicted nucleotidyltransferase